MSASPKYEIKLSTDVSKDEEHRYTPEDGDLCWKRGPATYYGKAVWVEVRPKQQPNPRWIGDFEDTTRLIFTTVGEMRDRTDLDQWEYADTAPNWFGWQAWTDQPWDSADDDLPVVVRRAHS